MKNKEDCTTAHLSDGEYSRYSRHLSLPEIGIEGQQKLKSSSVLCVGCGGLGSPLLMYLAAAGIGRIGIVDLDLVEESNLQRQVIHSTSSIGQKKADSAKNFINNLNPLCEVIVYDENLTNENALKIIEPFDIICDCTDNFPSKYLINDACVILKKPNISGSVAGFEGQVSVFNLTEESPNYRDLIPEPPPSGIIYNCSEAGVMGVLPGLIGLIQATEAIKIIVGKGHILDGRVLIFNALEMTFKELNLKTLEPKYNIRKLINYDTFCSKVKDCHKQKIPIICETISVNKLHELLSVESNQITLIDVRNRHEFLEQSITGALLFPLKTIENGESIEKLRAIASQTTLYVYCKSGKRSINAIKELTKFGIKGINILGGIDEWNKEITS